MRSPIARGLRAASRLAEWAHRRIHGPEFAPGDVVENRFHVEWKQRATLEQRRPGQNVWVARAEDGGTFLLHELEIIRVVRYGEEE